MQYNSKADALSSVKMHFAEYMWPKYTAHKATFDGAWNGKWVLVFNSKG
jgi:hypothetical protein